MEELFTYLIPILVLSVLVAGWGAVQFLAKKMNVKNHIDHGGCCGACENRDTCSK
ncbi:MAG: hypothetical protein KJP21_08105 [Bacteroidia bacterium]|nr:hypothetical protein [Bacteroidia bacterium]NNJ54878.1 hypothetical protein [Bacteroidia bacterium]